MCRSGRRPASVPRAPGLRGARARGAERRRSEEIGCEHGPVEREQPQACFYALSTERTLLLEGGEGLLIMLLRLVPLLQVVQRRALWQCRVAVQVSGTAFKDGL